MMQTLSVRPVDTRLFDFTLTCMWMCGVCGETACHVSELLETPSGATHTVVEIFNNWRFLCRP